MSDKKSLYESLWEKGKEIVKTLNKPVARRKDIRSFKGAYDEADDKGDKARKELNELLESKIGNYGDSMDRMITLFRTEWAAEECKADIKKFYLEVFGKELKVEEE